MVRITLLGVFLCCKLACAQTTEKDLFRRGLAYFKEEAYRKAVVDFTNVLQLNDQHALAYLYRGMAQNAVGDNHAAYKDFTEHINLHGGDGQVYYHRTRASMELGNYQFAQDDIAIALIYESRKGVYHYLSSKIHQAQGDYEQALTAIDQAIRLSPGKWDYLYDRINVLLGLDKTDPALRDIELLIRRDTQDPKAYNVRASIYFQVGDRVSACRDWRMAGSLGDRSVVPLIRQFCQDKEVFTRNNP